MRSCFDFDRKRGEDESVGLPLIYKLTETLV